jgi:hypothetical protein
MPTNVQINMQLVYVIPSFSPPSSWPSCSNCPPRTWSPTNIIPYYAFTGTINQISPTDGSTNTVNLKIGMIPATDDTNYVPSINLLASQVGTQVVASVSASGGSPPYTYQWSGSATVSSNNGASISYTPLTRVGPPPLAIASDASHAVVNVLLPAGFVLESATNLAAPHWNQVSSPVETNAAGDGFDLAAIPATASAMYFRLRQASQTVPATETLGVTVIDANGVSIHTSQTLVVQAQPVPLVAGPGDPPSYGT